MTTASRRYQISTGRRLEHMWTSNASLASLYRLHADRVFLLPVLELTLETTVGQRPHCAGPPVMRVDQHFVYKSRCFLNEREMDPTASTLRQFPTLHLLNVSLRL